MLGQEVQVLYGEGASHSTRFREPCATRREASREDVGRGAIARKMHNPECRGFPIGQQHRRRRSVRAVGHHDLRWRSPPGPGRAAPALPRRTADLKGSPRPDARVERSDPAAAPAKRETLDRSRCQRSFRHWRRHCALAFGVTRARPAPLGAVAAVQLTRIHVRILSGGRRRSRRPTGITGSARHRSRTAAHGRDRSRAPPPCARRNGSPLATAHVDAQHLALPAPR